MIHNMKTKITLYSAFLWLRVYFGFVVYYKDTGKTIVRVGKKYFRPTEVETLLGDARKAKKILKWKPKISFNQMIKEMIESDLELAKKEFV